MFISTGKREHKFWVLCSPPPPPPSQKKKRLAHRLSTSRQPCMKKPCTSLLSQPGWSSVYGKPKTNKGKLLPDVGSLSGSFDAPGVSGTWAILTFSGYLKEPKQLYLFLCKDTTQLSFSRTIWANRSSALNSSDHWSIKAMLNKPCWTIYNLTSHCAKSSVYRISEGSFFLGLLYFTPYTSG